MRSPALVGEFGFTVRGTREGLAGAVDRGERALPRLALPAAKYLVFTTAHYH